MPSKLSEVMTESYLTILNPSKSELKEKGSKFLAFAFPVSNEEEVKNNLRKLKEEYWDASHHCYAYRLGAEGEVYRANDAGEPNHSAGDPILSQIKSLNLTDVLVVVVRYFGGTKLGVSGLISAYKAATRSSLIEADVVKKYLMETIEIKFGFEQMSFVMKNIKSIEVEVLEQDYDPSNIKTKLRVRVRIGQVENLLDNLKGALGIEITRNL
jgi:uncharacterized YigZ family protein